MNETLKYHRVRIFLFFFAAVTVLISGASRSFAAMSFRSADTPEVFDRLLSELVWSREQTGENEIQSLDPYAAGRLIVQAKGNVAFGKTEPEQILAGPDHLYILQYASPAKARKAQKRIAAWKNVVYAEPDAPVWTMDTVSDLSGSPQTAGSDSGEEAANVSADLDPGNWNVTMIRAGQYAEYVKSKNNGKIRVAVVDSGVDYTHPDLKKRVIKGYDYIDSDKKPLDENGHGTHVAGVVAACTPGLKVKILAVRVTNEDGKGYVSVAGKGVRWAADHDASVINISMGSRTHSDYYDSAVKYAISKGAVVVTAAQNNARNLNFYDDCPAHMPECIVVSAVDWNKNFESYSNYGDSIDVAAPGTMISSCALGGGYRYDSGTSMSAPHVSAGVAMLRLLYPDKSPAKIEKLVKKYALDLGIEGKDPYYGYGLFRLPKKKVIIEAKSVSLDLKKKTVYLGIGSSITLTPEILPADTTDRSLTWTSSDESIATVKKGKVTFKSTGKVTVTVKTKNGKKAKCRFTVKKKTVPKDAVSYKGHHYKRYDRPMTWKKAEAYCEKKGGHLITVTKKAEQKFAVSCLLDGGTYDTYWMGARFLTDNWKWVTGEKMKYTNWNTADGEPDASGIYMQMYYRSGIRGLWGNMDPDDAADDASRKQAFICEWDY